MAARKDNKGRALRKGEFRRASNGKYVYGYTDPNGERRYIYSKDMTKLREREKKLVKDRLTVWMCMFMRQEALCVLAERSKEMLI